MKRIYRYSGKQESFLAVDGRDVEVPRFRERRTVHALCLINEVDAILVVDKAEAADFRVDCYGRDGLPCRLSADAARCSVAFADLLGVKPFHSQDFKYETPDGTFDAAILSQLGECKTVSVDVDGTRVPGPAFCEGEFE